MSETDKSNANLFSEFDLICDFPFPVGAFAELRRYVRAVHQFLPHTSAQHAVRIEAQLSHETDPVRSAELEYELDAVHRDAAVILPRIVWGGVLVTIFAAYENGVRSTLKYWQSTTGHSEEFRCLPRKDFLKSAEEYAKTHVGVALFQTDVSRETLTALKSFRNSFAHGSGLVLDLPDKLVAAIRNSHYKDVTFEIIEGQWVANAKTAAYFLISSERAIKQFGDAVLEKCLR